MSNTLYALPIIFDTFIGKPWKYHAKSCTSVISLPIRITTQVSKFLRCAATPIFSLREKPLCVHRYSMKLSRMTICSRCMTVD